MIKEKSKLERINKKNNFYNFLPRLFWRLLNIIIYRTFYFLDTNILILDKNHKDKRMRKFSPFNKKIVVSEPIHYEVLRKINENKNFESNFRFYNVVSIDKIKEDYPEACPVYYNAVIGMNNSAIINNPNFLYERYLYSISRDKDDGLENEKKYWNKMMDTIKGGMVKKYNILGDKRDDRQKLIEEAFFNSIKKKKKSIGKFGKVNINDYKNIATAFSYSIFYRKNVVLVTADYDLVYSFLVLIDNIIQQMVFMQLILEKISTENNYKDRIGKGEVIKIYIKKEDFDKIDDGLRGDILNHDWKKYGFRFSINFWDIKKQKYIKPVWINFDKKTLDLFEKTHGGVTCPFVKNIDYGNWLSCKYYWPPRDIYSLTNNLIEFELKGKKNIYIKSQKVSREVHNTVCHFSKLDQEGGVGRLSSFCEDNITD